jgi:hypothetical protein
MSRLCRTIALRLTVMFMPAVEVRIESVSERMT